MHPSTTLKTIMSISNFGWMKLKVFHNLFFCCNSVILEIFQRRMVVKNDLLLGLCCTELNKLSFAADHHCYLHNEH